MNLKQTLSSNEIIKEIAQIEWKQAGYKGEVLVPSLEDLSQKVKLMEWKNPKAFLTAIPPEEYPILPIDPEPLGDTEKAWYRLERCYLSHANHYPSNLYQVLEDRRDEPIEHKVVDQGEHHNEETGKTIYWQKIETKSPPLTEVENHEKARVRNTVLLEMAHILWGLLFERNITFVHDFWQQCRGNDPSLRHPLAPLIQAWQREQIPRVEPSRRKDTGILHHAIGETHPSPRLPLTVMETMPGESEQLMLITNPPQIELQLELPGFVFPESEQVPALLLEARETVGGRPSQQGRGAPISQRLFFNILVEYELKQRGLYETSRLNTNYRDVKSWLYPQGTKEPKNRLIPRLYKGMYELHNQRFLWKRRAWNIISVDSLPTMNIKPDDMLTFTVRMPPGMNTTNGALIGIEPMRIYGAQSAPKFRAWIRLAYLWDTAKIRNGGSRIYATIPGALRNKDRYLVNAKGEVILTGNLYKTKHGWECRDGNNPQTAWYHPLAILTGGTVPNPQVDKVPVLSDSDMVKLFFDHTERKGETFRKSLEMARKHAWEMQDDGRIDVVTNQIDEKTGVKGWRILEPYQRKR